MAEKSLGASALDNIENNRWGAFDGVEIPINIEPPIEALQEYLELINNILNFTLSILDFIKSFLANFLNPILALIKKIIQFIKDIINDIKQIGIYITSDIGSVFTQDWDALDNGYSGFERRMLARLSDYTDPQRPDFSPNSACFAIYIYLDTDFLADFWAIWKAIKKIIAFFTGGWDNDAGSLPVPVSITSSIEEKRSEFLSDPDVKHLKLDWKMATVSQTAAPPIGGFLIETSVLPDGLTLIYTADSPNGAITAQGDAKKRRGVCRTQDGSVVKVFGGASLVGGLIDGGDTSNTGGDAYYMIRSPTDNKQIKLTALRSDDIQVYSRTIDLIEYNPAELLKIGEQGILQRTFFKPVHAASFFGSDAFSALIPLDTLPQTGDVSNEEVTGLGKTSRVYVRISTVDTDTRKAIEKASNFNFTPVLFEEIFVDPNIGWDLISDSKTGGMIKDVLAKGKSPRYALTVQSVKDPTKYVEAGVGQPSAIASITVPNEHEDFRRLCFNVIANVILRRYENLTEEMASRKVAQKLSPEIANYAVKIVNPLLFNNQSSTKYLIKWKFNQILSFRRDFSFRIDALITKALDRAYIPYGLQEALVEKNKELNATGTNVLSADKLSLLIKGAFETMQFTVDPDTNIYSDYSIYAANGRTATTNFGKYDWWFLLKEDKNKDTGVMPTFSSAFTKDELVWACNALTQRFKTDPENNAAKMREYAGIPDTSRTKRAARLNVAVESQAPTTLWGEERNLPVLKTLNVYQGNPVKYRYGNRSRVDLTNTPHIRFITNDPESGMEGLSLTVLNLLFGSYSKKDTGSWRAYRLMEQGWPWMEQFLNGLVNTLEVIEESLQAFIQKILDAIAAVESKIKRIQAIIAMIDEFLERLKGFKFEFDVPANLLMHMANGTDDLMTKLCTAESKPYTQGPETKSFGLLLVGGGIPSILMEWILTLFSSSEDEENIVEIS